MRCEGCGASGWFKTLRWRSGKRRFVLCDGCYAPLAASVWIVAGEVNVASRCALCHRYVRPTEITPESSRPGGGYKRDIVSSGVCRSCSGTMCAEEGA